MKIKFLGVLTAGLFEAMSSLSAQAPPHLKSLPPIVYVSNGGGGISEVNTDNNFVIATAPFPNLRTVWPVPHRPPSEPRRER